MAGIFDTGIFDHATPLGIFDHLAATPAPGFSTGGWEWLNSLNPPRAEKEPEPIKRKPKRKRIVIDAAQIELAPDPIIETGIVQVAPALNALRELHLRAEEAEIERRNRLLVELRKRLLHDQPPERLRAIARADDDWLMLV